MLCRPLMAARGRSPASASAGRRDRQGSADTAAHALSKLRRMCKARYAACQVGLPPCLPAILFVTSVKTLAIVRKMALDMNAYAAYCDLHINRLATHDQTPDQDRSTARDGHAQSATRARARTVVRSGRLLRRQRPAAGEVRDAASCPPGRRHQGRGCRAVRRVAANLLPGRSRLRSSRPGGGCCLGRVDPSRHTSSHPR